MRKERQKPMIMHGWVGVQESNKFGKLNYAWAHGLGAHVLEVSQTRADCEAEMKRRLTDADLEDWSIRYVTISFSKTAFRFVRGPLTVTQRH
jgi:hypothetical protein